MSKTRKEIARDYDEQIRWRTKYFSGSKEQQQKALAILKQLKEQELAMSQAEIMAYAQKIRPVVRGSEFYVGVYADDLDNCRNNARHKQQHAEHAAERHALVDIVGKQQGERRADDKQQQPTEHRYLGGGAPHRHAEHFFDSRAEISPQRPRNGICGDVDFLKSKQQRVDVYAHIEDSKMQYGNRHKHDVKHQVVSLDFVFFPHYCAHAFFTPYRSTTFSDRLSCL